MVYTVEYHSAVNKSEIPPVGMMWMELECIMLSKTSPPEKDKYRMISLICGIWDAKQMNIFEGAKKETEANHKRLLSIKNKLRVDGGEVGRGMG